MVDDGQGLKVGGSLISSVWLEATGIEKRRGIDGTTTSVRLFVLAEIAAGTIKGMLLHTAVVREHCTGVGTYVLYLFASVYWAVFGEGREYPLVLVQLLQLPFSRNSSSSCCSDTM